MHAIHSIEEIWEAIPQLKDNPLVKRVVEVFDEDQSGGVDFKEFVLGRNYHLLIYTLQYIIFVAKVMA